MRSCATQQKFCNRMKTCLLFSAIVILLFSTAYADPILPSFPLSNPYSLNFTYDTFFFNPTVQTNLSAQFYANPTANKFAIYGKDPIRSHELILFRYDQGKTFVLSKFGEFAWKCRAFAQDSFIGKITAIPPILAPSQFASLAKYQGEGTIKLPKLRANTFDMYSINATNPNLNSKVISLYFDQGTSANRNVRKIVEQITDLDGNIVTRSALFANDPLVGTPDDSIFEIPSGVKCQ